MSSSEVVLVRTKTMNRLLTCTLCNEHFKDATSLSECLHTFCRTCICRKILEEGLDHCPICNHHLGSYPFDRMRPDMDWNCLRESVFRKRPQVEEEPSMPMRGRRKERSLSSLGVMNSNEPTRQTPVRNRRSRFNRRNNPSPQNQNDSGENQDVAQVVDLNLNQPLPVIPEEPPTCVFPRQLNLNEPAQDTDESSAQEDADVWQPLSYLADAAMADAAMGEGSGKSVMEDAAIRQRSGKSVMEDAAVGERSRPSARKIVLGLPRQTEADIARVRAKERRANRNKKAPAMSEPVEPRKLRSSRRRAATVEEAPIAASATENTNVTPQEPRTATMTTQRSASATEDTNVSPQEQAQAVVAATAAFDMPYPIWFSLTACDDHYVNLGFALLPQIPSKFIKVSARDLPVSHIMKYLAKKLDLATDVEVQMFLKGAPLPPTLQLNNLLIYWLQAGPHQEPIQTTAGSSGEPFVLPLFYARIKPFN